MTKSIQVKNRPALALVELLEQFEAAVKEGYTLDKNNHPTLVGNTAFMTMFVNLKERTNEPEIIPTVEITEEESSDAIPDTNPVESVPEDEPSGDVPSMQEQIEALSSVEDAKALAEANGFELHPAMKNMDKIKAKLLEQLEA